MRKYCRRRRDCSSCGYWQEYVRLALDLDPGSAHWRATLSEAREAVRDAGAVEETPKLLLAPPRGRRGTRNSYSRAGYLRSMEPRRVCFWLPRKEIGSETGGGLYMNRTSRRNRIGQAEEQERNGAHSGHRGTTSGWWIGHAATA